MVNSIEYARALKKGTAGDLLKKQGITYLVNHGIMDNGEDKELKQLADKLFGKAHRIICDWKKPGLSRFVEALTGLARESGRWLFFFIE